MSYLSERAAKVVRNGNPTNTAWLRGWDAAVASLRSSSNPYTRAPQRQAWSKGYEAGWRSSDTDVLAMNNRTKSSARRVSARCIARAEPPP